jgi:hypothetical protein
MTSDKVYYYSDFIRQNADLSLKNSSEMVALAYSFRQQTSIIFIDVLQAVSSLLALVFIYCCVRSSEMRRVFSIVELDLKVITHKHYVKVTLDDHFVRISLLHSWISYHFRALRLQSCMFFHHHKKVF